MKNLTHNAFKKKKTDQNNYIKTMAKVKIISKLILTQNFIKVSPLKTTLGLR